MDQAYSKVKAAVLSFSIFFIIGAVERPHAYCCTQLFKTSSTISNSWPLAHASQNSADEATIYSMGWEVLKVFVTKQKGDYPP